MTTWLEWARGPVFYFSLTFMVLGLIRHLVLTWWTVRKVRRRAGDPDLPWGNIVRATAQWLVPVGKLRERWLYTLTSLVFHVAIILVPLFLGGHIVLWSRGLGLSWPALPPNVADILTIVALVTAVALVLQRATVKATRALSRVQDYALPLIIAVPFATGFLVMHPSLNPFGYEATLLAHALSGNLVLVLMPLTKLSHVVLFPGVQLVSELGWKWPADSGRQVTVALGKEEEPV